MNRINSVSVRDAAVVVGDQLVETLEQKWKRFLFIAAWDDDGEG